MQRALDWQARAITGEGDFKYLKSATCGPAFACSVNESQPCGWGANKAMRALLAVPPDRRTPVIERAIQSGADFLLSRDPAVADYPYTTELTTWLLEGPPWLEYRTRVDLPGQPEEDLDLQAARWAMPTRPKVKALLVKEMASWLGPPLKRHNGVPLVASRRFFTFSGGHKGGAT